MAHMHQLIPVPFHGDTLQLVDESGQPFVPARPITDNLGLAWEPQYRKLMSGQKRWGVTMMVTPSAGGPQQTLCLPLRKLPAFLFSIDPRKVKPEVKNRLAVYQEECDEALWSFWAQTHAPQALPEPPRRTVELDEADFWKLKAELAELKLERAERNHKSIRRNATPEEEHRIIAMVRSGVGPAYIAAQLDRSPAGVDSIIRRLRRSGRL